MNFFPVFSAWQFAAAGLVCTAIPLAIHLLNRRRYRVVEWGAMQFLREAVQQKRRIMRLRDILLLLLRMAAVACFGLALSQPYFAARSQPLAAGQPVHAVLLIDNSLSMGYQTLAGTDLDAAKQRAAEIIDRLPTGSRMTVLPLCGSMQPVSFEPYDTKPHAAEALQRIEVVDRSMTIQQAINSARRAAEATPDMPTRAILFSDQQQINWSDLATLKNDSDLPALQLVQVIADQRDNSWVAEIDIQDGVADAQTPAIIRAILKHRGAQPRSDVRVGLWVNNQEVASQLVQFNAAEATREVTFEHTFREFQPLPNQPAFVPVKVSLTPDRLPADDERYLLAPIVAGLPVTFIDQYGESQEDASIGRFGETRHLRHLVALGAGGDSSQRFARIRHLTIDRLNRDTLADSRLVVIAGVSNPADKVALLRQYVEQGGELVIAAGAAFNPAAWNELAWLDGRGILPLPLLADPIGSVPEAAEGDLRPFYLSYESMSNHPYFQLAGNSEQDLRDLFAEPFFFKAVRVDEADSDKPQLQSKVIARFTSNQGPPFLVERRIGAGRVLLVTSGLLSSWNSLPKTNAMVIFDRILREMIQSTLSQRNFGPLDTISIPIADEVRDAQIVLQRPAAASPETLDTGFVSEDEFGVVIERPFERGIYQLTAYGSQGPADSATQTPRWQFQVAVNGNDDESDLTPIDRTIVDDHNTGGALSWVGPNEEISLAGVGIRGQDLWWWLAASVLFVLILELLVLGSKK